MSKKSCKWFATIISIGLLLLLLPLFFGILTEYKFKQVIQSAARFTGMSADIVTYHHGWFNSDAVVVFSLPANNFIKPVNQFREEAKRIFSRMELRQLVLHAHIFHGPLIINKFIALAAGEITSDINLNCNADVNPGFCSSSKPVASMMMLVGLLGSVEINLTSPHISYKTKKTNFEWLSLSARFYASDLLSTEKCEIYWQGINLLADNWSLQVNDFYDDYYRKRRPGNFYYSTNKIRLKSFALVKNDKYKVSVSDLAINSVSHKQHGLFGGDTKIDISKFAINADNYRNISIDWSTDKFNGSMVAKVHEQAALLRNMAKPPSREIKDTFNLLASLLNNNATLSLNKLDIISPWGHVYANANIIFKPRNRHIEGLLAIITNSDFDFKLVLDKTLAEHLLAQYYQLYVASDKYRRYKYHPESLLTKFAKMGLITSDNNSYAIAVSYRKDNLLINNQPFPLF